MGNVVASDAAASPDATAAADAASIQLNASADKGTAGATSTDSTDKGTAGAASADKTASPDKKPMPPFLFRMLQDLGISQKDVEVMAMSVGKDGSMSIEGVELETNTPGSPPPPTSNPFTELPPLTAEEIAALDAASASMGGINASDVNTIGIQVSCMNPNLANVVVMTRASGDIPIKVRVGLPIDEAMETAAALRTSILPCKVMSTRMACHLIKMGNEVIEGYGFSVDTAKLTPTEITFLKEAEEMIMALSKEAEELVTAAEEMFATTGADIGGSSFSINTLSNSSTGGRGVTFNINLKIRGKVAVTVFSSQSAAEANEKLIAFGTQVREHLRNMDNLTKKMIALKTMHDKLERIKARLRGDKCSCTSCAIKRIIQDIMEAKAAAR